MHGMKKAHKWNICVYTYMPTQTYAICIISNMGNESIQCNKKEGYDNNRKSVDPLKIFMGKLWDKNILFWKDWQPKAGWICPGVLPQYLWVLSLHQPYLYTYLLLICPSHFSCVLWGQGPCLFFMFHFLSI